jgi:two-component system response regulator YesN
VPELSVINESHIEKLDDIQLLQHLLDSFSTITKMFVAVTDVDGCNLLSSERGETDFCRLIKSTDMGMYCCCGSYARAGREAEKWNEPYFFKCHAGLIAWACPVLLDGRHEGNFICGQVLMWQPDKYYIQEVIDNTKKLDIDSAALTKAAKKLEVISAEQMQAAADLLYVTANYFAQSGTSTLDYQQKLRKISSWLWNENYNEKHLNTPAATEEDILDLEKRFFKELRLSHQESSKELLKRMAIMFFIHSKGKIEIIKGMSIEFISLLTRFSTECGTKFEESIRYSFQRLNELEEADTVEKVILWLLTTGNSYIDLLTEKDADPQETIINRAITYIRENYASQDLSLSTIASNCHISPSYLSRIFKQKKGHTITEQVNRTRIEEAKYILQDCDSTVSETAQKVGFADRSYFYKVFKKQVGLSPSVYKGRF